MTKILIAIFVVVCCVIIITSFRNKPCYLTYPFWAALTFCGFALPQFISLDVTGIYPGISLEKYIIMAIICLISSYIGFKLGCVGRLDFHINKMINRIMIDRYLRFFSFIYTLIGFLAFFMLYKEDTKFVNQYWEGPSTIYVFLAGFAVYGFILSMDSFFRNRKPIDLFMMFPGLGYFLLRILIHGRRTSAIYFIIIVLGFLWFRCKKVVPVSIIVGVIVLGLVVSASMNAYRMAVADELNFSELRGINFINNFMETFREGHTAEVLNGCYVIETCDRTLKFDYGLYNWNAAIQAFVSRQIVGEKLKQSLMVRATLDDDIYSVFRYTKDKGTQYTGIADAYLALSYAGCLKFLVMGFILGILYFYANSGASIAILLYVYLLPASITSLSLGTHGFSNSLIQLACFFFPALSLSSRR